MANMPGIKHIILLEMTEDWETYVVEFTDGTTKRLTIEHTKEEQEQS